MSNPIALWVTPVSNLAGVARHILDVARVGLPGYDLVVSAPPGPLGDRLELLGVQVMPLPIEGVSIRQSVTTLRATIAEVQPTVVHSHLAKADFLAALAAPRHTTLVSTEHHIPEDPLVFHGTKAKALARQAAHHARIRRFAALTAVSQSTKRDMLRHWKPTAPITVVLNGADRIDHTNREQREPGLRLLSLARLSAEKNIEMTLRVFARVHAQYPQARLTIGGDGDERDRLVQLADNLAIADVVDFAGFISAEEAMATHDVLLQPSKADNLSYTLLDAVNHGMGVVASDIGGNPEILPDRCVRGLDDAEGMTEAVVEQGLNLSARPALPETIPTVAQMSGQITDVYAEVLR